MDRDNRWERSTKKVMMQWHFAKPKNSKDVQNYIKDSYKEEIFDEFLAPTAFEGYDGFEKK